MAKSNIPKKTKINGVQWRVMPKRQVILDGEACEGVCHYDHQLLEISVGSGDDFKIMDTFYHEYLHAIIESAGVTIHDETEHAIINNVARHLAANCDWRKLPRKQKKTKPVLEADVVSEPKPKKRR